MPSTRSSSASAGQFERRAGLVDSCRQMDSSENLPRQVCRAELHPGVKSASRPVHLPLDTGRSGPG